VTEVLEALPRDPNAEGTYYYLSNGKSFTLWAQTDNPAPASDCPAGGPRPDFDPGHEYCVRGSPPGGG
jgi:hypothetical protein